MRHLILVLGDQLDKDSAALDGLDAERDRVWMAENEEESTHVWSHKLRLALFFSAMRHFRDELRSRGCEIEYHALSWRRSADRGGNFAEILRKDVRRLRPEKLIVVQPGDWRVQSNLQEAADDLDIELEIRRDRHFYCDIDEFQNWARGKKSLVLETFYRQMRKKHEILVDEDGKPEGGSWNYDSENRESFGKQGPPHIKPPRRFTPDEVTNDVREMVAARFKEHPGSLEDFHFPVTHAEARAALRDFIKDRLPKFGDHQDAMWTDEPFLYHSRLSTSLNLHLLNPRAAVDAAVEAYRDGQAPLNAVEGFVRQILGWREFIRGIYWMKMPEYAELNGLEAAGEVPDFFWNGETDMVCVEQAMRQLLDHGYAHHIQRLMVLGLFAQLAGVHPYKFHEWHMALYPDAIDWVSLPNALGMSQHADGGIVGTKPYCATGKYIDRMSNYCSGCRYEPGNATGENACPFTTLYWDFLSRHRSKLEKNNRMRLQVKNLDRKEQELPAMREQAAELRDRLRGGERV